MHLAAPLGSPVAVSQAPGAAKRQDPLSVTIIQRPGNAGVLKSVNGSAGARRPRVAAQTLRQGQRVPRRTTNSPCRARAAAGGDAADVGKRSLPGVAEVLPHTRSASNFRQRSGRRSEGLRSVAGQPRGRCFTARAASLQRCNLGSVLQPLARRSSTKIGSPRLRIGATDARDDGASIEPKACGGGAILNAHGRSPFA